MDDKPGLCFLYIREHHDKDDILATRCNKHFEQEEKEYEYKLEVVKRWVESTGEKSDEVIMKILNLKASNDDKNKGVGHGLGLKQAKRRKNRIIESMLVGYDAAKRFIIRNAWRTDWGMKGYFTMPYNYLADRNLVDDL